MLDMAMIIASAAPFSTASLHLEIFKPAKGAKLRVYGEIVRQGRRIVFAEAEMRNEDDEIVARGRQTAVPPAVER